LELPRLRPLLLRRLEREELRSRCSVFLLLDFFFCSEWETRSLSTDDDEADRRADERRPLDDRWAGMAKKSDDDRDEEEVDEEKESDCCADE